MKQSQWKSFLGITVLLTIFISLPVWGDGAVAEDPEHSEQARLEEQEIDEMIGRLFEEQPEHAQSLLLLREADPDHFRRRLRDLWRQRHPEEFERMMRDEPFPPEGRGMEFDQPHREHRPDRRARRGGDRDVSPEEQMMKMRNEGERGRGRGREHRPVERFRNRLLSIQERRNEYIEWLQEHYPEEAEELERLQEEDEPDMYMRRLMLSYRKYGRIMELEEENPELADVVMEDMELKEVRDELLRDIRIAEGQEREELVDHLHEIVSRRFDLIVRRKQLQYEEMLERLEELEQEVHKREAEVDKLIERKDQATDKRVEELLGSTERINWE